MGLLIVAAMLATPIALLALILRLRQQRHPGGGYGGRFDGPGRMSLMTYAEVSSLVDNHSHSLTESAASPFQETDVTNPNEL